MLSVLTTTKTNKQTTTKKKTTKDTKEAQENFRGEG